MRATPSAARVGLRNGKQDVVMTAIPTWHSDPAARAHLRPPRRSAGSISKMGCVFSSSSSSSSSRPTAKVVSVNGNLRQYSVPVTAGHVLKNEAGDSEEFFVCNSDKLYFDKKIPPLDANDALQAGQIYFVLPVRKLQYPLTAADMASMAVKASTAINEGWEKGRGWGRKKGRKMMQISPVFEVEGESSVVGDFDVGKRFRVERSGSVRKLQMNASRRAKMAYRSFKARLSTIYEVSVSE